MIMLGKGRLFARNGRRRRTHDMPADSPKNAAIGFWNKKTASSKIKRSYSLVNAFRLHAPLKDIAGRSAPNRSNSGALEPSNVKAPKGPLRSGRLSLDEDTGRHSETSFPQGVPGRGRFEPKR